MCVDVEEGDKTTMKKLRTRANNDSCCCSCRGASAGQQRLTGMKQIWPLSVHALMHALLCARISIIAVVENVLCHI
jgi:hypothetical protein